MTLRPGPYAELATGDTFDALQAFEAEAGARGVEPAVLATAWVLSDPRVTALVVGSRSPRQLETALAALELRLAPDERDELAGLFA
jgi:aryl-alcohol dehydrogenase-like predicted oxidoreductase